MNLVLSKLREIASAVLAAAEATDIDHVLQRIAEVAKELIHVRYAALGIPNGKGGLRHFKTTGMTPEEIQMLEHPPHGHGLIGAIMRERQVIRLEKMKDDPRSVGFPENHPVMVSLLGVPIQMGQQLFGVFYLCDRVDEQPFDEQDQLLVETLAGYAALAIAGAEISHQHSRLALLEERERIGMELHDGIIQSLYGIGMQVELVRSSQTMIPTQALAPVVDSLNEVIEDIRTFIMELRQRDQNQKTIRQSIEQLLTRLYLPPTLEVVIDAPYTTPPFSPAVYESILLIVNEALSNAVRHANATQLQVQVVQDRAQFSVVVIDNGRGFDLSQVGLQPDGNDLANGSKGLGLQNMQRRARLYGGAVHIDTADGRGTHLRIQIPMRAY